MDETGHSGDTGAAEGGNGADPRERGRMNGWQPPESPWAPEPENEVPAWRRPVSEFRPLTRSEGFTTGAIPVRQPGAVRPNGQQPAPVQPTSPAPVPTPPGFIDASGNPSSGEGPPATKWSEGRSRYSELLAPLEPPSQVAGRPGAPLRGFDVPSPHSAPPYPYEGDLDDTEEPPGPGPLPPRAGQAAVPLVRPAAPAARRSEWSSTEPTQDKQEQTETPYDSPGFPRRLGYEPPEQPSYTPPPPPPAFSGFPQRGPEPAAPRRAVDLGDQGARVLPQRVPAQPDVPRVPEPPLVEPTAETPALARIATHLRRGDVLPAQERQEGFDVQAILAAVRGVDGVRDASLRSTPTGAHSLRLDLAEGADPAEVSRRVARLLQDRMGLDAAMKGEAAIPAIPSPARPVSPASGSAPVSPARPMTTPALPTRPSSGRPDADRPDSSRLDADRLDSSRLDNSRPDNSRLDTGRLEAGRLEAGRLEAGRSDAGRPDSGRLDSGRVDAGRMDSGRLDSGRLDSGRLDSGRAEAGRLEAGRLEAGRLEAGRLEGGRSEAGRSEAGRSEIGRTESARSEVVRSEVVRPARPVSPAARPISAVPTSTPLLAPVTGEHHGHRERVSDSDIAENDNEQKAVVPSGADPRPLFPAHEAGPRIVIESVNVNTYGTEATVEVRLAFGGRIASGEASGPAVDGYLLRLCATATAGAVDDLLSTSDHPDAPVRCFVEHAASVPFGASQVAVVMLLLSCNGWVEQLSGSAVISGDDRISMVRATLAAVNRRLEALLTG